MRGFLANQSIAVRLAISALFSSAMILLVAGAILSALYREATERAFDNRLLVYANDLASDLVAPASPDQRALSLGDPRFDLPLSGWYWQVSRPDPGTRDVRPSRSLFGGELPPAVPGAEKRPFGEVRKGYVQAPDERWLRIVERDIDLGEDGRFVVRVAGPADEIDADVRRFTVSLTITFVLLGISLGATALLQIRFGLDPLLKLQNAVSAIRRGEAERITGRYSPDVAPLAQELNLLLDTNREILERARTQVGNLAHALKTPLSVIVNEVTGAPEALAEKLREQATIMRHQVDYHLDRARAAALAGTLGSLTDAKEPIEALVRTFSKIYRSKDLVITAAIPEAVRFRGERQDLEEMVGNLVDNACKWASSQVRVTADVVPGARSTLRITIEDDGPGVPEQARSEMLRRGRRLDETKPGSGLGLSIVVDLAGLYRGSLSLADSSLGGLCAVLELPGDRG